MRKLHSLLVFDKRSGVIILTHQHKYSNLKIHNSRINHSTIKFSFFSPTSARRSSVPCLCLTYASHLCEEGRDVNDAVKFIYHKIIMRLPFCRDLSFWIMPAHCWSESGWEKFSMRFGFRLARWLPSRFFFAIWISKPDLGREDVLRW